MEEYKHFKSKLKIEINKAKLLWTTSHSSNAASFWNVINDLTGRKTISPMTKLIQEYNQNTDKLANDINKMFRSAIIQSGKLPKIENTIECYIEINEVLDELNKLKAKKSITKK